MNTNSQTVHVIATSVEGTREALDAAAVLARGVSGKVVLFLPRGAPDAASEGAIRSLSAAYDPRPTVISCVCEQPLDITQLFQVPALVVIGGQARWWWPTAEQRLARALSRLGCHVSFVHVAQGRFVPPLVAAARAEAQRTHDMDGVASTAP